MEELKEYEDILIRIQSSLPICRICLEYSMEYIEFESPLCVINDEEITFSDALREVSTLAYDLPEKISNNICIACGNELLNAYLFLKRVENTNFILKQIKTLKLNTPLTNVEEGLSDVETDGFVESLKVEILDTPNEEFANPTKLDQSIETAIISCQQSKCNFQTLLESEFSADVDVDTCSDEKKSRCDGDCSTSGEDVDLKNHVLEPHEKKRLNEDSMKNHLKYDDKCLGKNVLHQHRVKQGCLTIKKYRGNRIAPTALHKRTEINKKCPDRPPNKIKKSQTGENMQTSDLACCLCGKKCLTKIGLKSHSRVHKERKYVCHICSKMCSTETTLKRHISHIHSSNCKKYQCEDCGLVFKYPSYLRDHQRTHDVKTKYKCPFCDRSYCRKTQFDIHLRYHYNDYRYTCNHCNKGYATKSNLTDHIKSSHIKITYDCEKCDQKFKSITGLKKHTYSHTGYPYNCPICLLGQASRSGIKTHILGVHRGAISLEEFNKLFPLVHPKSGYRRPKVKSME